MIEMIVESMRVNPTTYQRVVILQEKNGGKYLPIWIGLAEANAIGVKMQGVEAPRPLTHDLMDTIIVETLGASVEYVVVSGLENDIFYAKIIIKTVDSTEREFDCRPSDAIVLALRAQVSIYAEKLVLDRVGITLDKETGKPIVGEGQKASEPRPKPKPVTLEESGGAFAPFIEGLDLEDFGEKK